MSLFGKTCLQLAFLSILASGGPPVATPSGPGPAALAAHIAAGAALEPAPAAAATPYVAVAVAGEPTPAQRQFEIQQQLRMILDLSQTGRAAETVLVIPGRQMEPQSADPLVEDLTIMSRIIQKGLADGFLAPVGSAMDTRVIDLGLPSQKVGPRRFFPTSRCPKAIYAGGYGALFFLRVDFPLVPPAQAPEQTGDEESDPVWSETRRMLYEPLGAGLATGLPAGEWYSEDKVAVLRGRLIELMKHAANIRTLDANDSVTIVVRGTAADDSQARRDAWTGLPGEAPCGRTVLTMRAAKSDIDLYAKGQLEPAQFEQRLQITNYKQ
jgi:hypothetical protein